MSNNLDPDQAQHFDLGPNCLPRLSVDDTSMQRVKKFVMNKTILRRKKQTELLPALRIYRYWNSTMVQCIKFVEVKL